MDNLAEVLAEPLAMVFTCCMKEEVVPPDWKTENVSQIYKYGSKGCPANYPLVNLTSLVCKIMESIVRDEMVDFLAKHAMLRLAQHVFMQKLITMTSPQEYLEVLRRVMDEGMAQDVV